MGWACSEGGYFSVFLLLYPRSAKSNKPLKKLQLSRMVEVCNQQ